MSATAMPATNYTQALAKGGALLAETRALLEAWQPGESELEFGARVLRDDVLGRSTAHRVKDLLRVFVSRFLRPTNAAALHLKTLLSGHVPRQLFSDLVLLYAARRDDLLRDFLLVGYWPAVREGRLTISNQDVARLILEAEMDGRIASRWSAENKRDMAGRVMVTLTEFGLFRELKPATRDVMPFSPTPETLVYVAYLLHDSGVTDADLAIQQDWRVFGLEQRDVWNRLDQLAGSGWFIVQRAGEVVRVTWNYASVEGVISVLAN